MRNIKAPLNSEPLIKKILLPLLMLMFSLLHAQEESEANKKSAKMFEQHYNAAQYEAIYEMYATAMKNVLSMEQTLAFLKNLHAQAGKIKEKEFVGYKNGAAEYKTTFERAVFSLQIAADAEAKINGLLVQPFVELNLPQLERNSTPLILPFKEEWTVTWGGDTKEQNYHVESRAQKNAFDLVITDKDGRSYQNDGNQNEDYYAFGKPLFAPADAEVVLVVDGVKDNKPGELNPIYVPGNTVILKTVNEEYLFFAHFKQHSIVVKQGQQIKQGELLGLCGNSGNSSEAHLHFHIQNVEDMNIATGVKCYFDEIMVNGVRQKDYSPVQQEKIKNP